MATTTLAQQLNPASIDVDVLHEHYHPMLELTKVLIGVVPNAASLLEIWQTGFRTYNLVVPNCLNLPFSLWGRGAPKALVSLAMYTSSRAGGCAYCSAHTCTLALRRGASVESIIEHPTPREKAVVAVAEGMAQVPSRLTAAHCLALTEHFSSDKVEWIVLAAGLMGFLNKFMDAVGVELEAEVIGDVSAILTPTGWTPGKHAAEEPHAPTEAVAPSADNFGTYLRVLRQAPSAIRMESTWTAGVPDRWPEAGKFLEQHTGYSFPLLGNLRHRRVIRAMATVLRDNLDATVSEIGLPVKCLAGLVYATVVENQSLASEACLLAKHFAPEMDESVLTALTQLATEPVSQDVEAMRQALSELSALPTLSEQDAAAIILARAASTSPAQIGPVILTEVSPLLSPAGVVELIVWLSVQQLLHRLSCFYSAMESAESGALK